MLKRPITLLAVAIVTATTAVAAGIPPRPGLAEEPVVPVTTVVPIDWTRFTSGLPTDEQAERGRAILLNANKYALKTWYPSKYGSQTGEYLDFGGTAEGNVRPPGSEALALATSLATGAYDEAVTGVPESHARAVAVRVTASLAYRHEANGPAGWGDEWQSALWAFNAAFAGWLLWDDLPAVDQQRLERMVAAEADRFLDFTVPYYQRPDGTVVTPGDSKAEENAWNAAFLNLAVSMLPRHPNAAVWRDKAIELMISAYSRPQDLQDDAEINGKPVHEWLGGSNIFADGTLVNHSRIHPDYFTSIANSVGAPLAYGLAGLRTPQAALFNADVVYGALVDHVFTSPPYATPGGTIYVRDPSGSATSAIYYPQGNDWGTSRQMHFLLLDTLAATFGFDNGASVQAADWAAAHATRVLEMQSRFTDGRTYGAPSEDTYSGREQWVALLAGRTYLTQWLDHNDGITFTNRAYPVTPADRPALDITLSAATNYPRGVATPLTLRVENRATDPVHDVSVTLALPAGWTVQPTGELPTSIEPGGTASVDWHVTPDEPTDQPVDMSATVGYRSYGRVRTPTLTAWVQVPPGVNVALGKPVTVSSTLRPEAGGDKAVDGLFTDASRWLSAPTDTTPMLTVDLQAPIPIDSIYVYSGYNNTNHDPTSTLKDFTVDVHTASGWVTVASFADNIEHRVVVDDLDVTGDQVRLSVSDPSASTIDVTRVFEVEVYETTM